LKFCMTWFFIKFHPMNMYFHKWGHVSIVQKIWNQLYDFMHFFIFFFKNVV
jgi:hypothetical protein